MTLIAEHVAIAPADGAAGTQGPAGRRARARAEQRRTRSLMLGESKLARVLAFVALLVAALLWLIPIAWGVLTSLKSETDAAATPLQIMPQNGFTLEAYRNVLTNGQLPRWLLNSVLVSLAVTIITVVISVLAAYALSRLDFRGRKWLLAVTLAAIMVPGQILIVPLFKEMIALHMVDTYWGMILPQVIAPVNVYILKKFFDGIPIELEEAARIDGAGPWRVMWSVIIPLSRPILVAVAIFTFIASWNNFLWPFIVTSNPDLMTMPVGIATVKNAYGVQYAQSMAAAVIAALPLLIVFMIFQRQIVKGIATTGLAGQ